VLALIVYRDRVNHGCAGKCTRTPSKGRPCPAAYHARASRQFSQ
jgi:hypothetical protein